MAGAGIPVRATSELERHYALWERVAAAAAAGDPLESVLAELARAARSAAGAGVLVVHQPDAARLHVYGAGDEALPLALPADAGGGWLAALATRPGTAATGTAATGTAMTGAAPTVAVGAWLPDGSNAATGEDDSAQEVAELPPEARALLDELLPGAGAITTAPIVARPGGDLPGGDLPGGDLLGSYPLGAVVIGAPAPRSLARFVAAQAGIAIRQAALADLAAAGQARLTTVGEIGRVLIAALDLADRESLYARIHTQVARVVPADTFCAGLYDPASGQLAFPYVYREGRRTARPARPLGDGPDGQAVRSRQLVVAGTPLADCQFEVDAPGGERQGGERQGGERQGGERQGGERQGGERQGAERQGAERQGAERQGPGGAPRAGAAMASAVYAPLVRGERVLGLLIVQSTRPAAYGLEDCQLLATIADQAAVAVENTQLYDEVRQRLERLSILHEVALAATSSLDFDQVIREAVRALQRSFGFDHVGLALRERTSGQLAVHPASLGTAAQAGPGSALLDWVAEAGLAARVDDVRTDPRSRGARADIRAALCVPLKVEDRTIGVINVESPQVGAFSLEDEQLLTIVAGQLAPLVDRARLYAQSQQRLYELGVLYDASMATAALLEPQSILQVVVEHMARAVDATSAYLADWDDELRRARTIAEYMGGRALPLERTSDLGRLYPLDEYPQDVEAIRAGKPYPVSVDDPRGAHPYQQEQLRAYGGLSALVIPLASKQRVMGFVELWESSRRREWSADEIRLCQTIAVQATAALEKAHLYDETRRRLAELTALQDISTRLTLSLELPDVLDAVTASVMRLVRPSDVHIYLWDAATQQFTFGTALWADGSRTAASEPRVDGLTARVVRGGAPLIIQDAERDPLFAGARERSWGLRAIAGFPLLHSGEVIGAFTLAFLDPHVFTPDELRLLGIFADHAAIAVRNAALYEQARQRAAELATLQRSSLELTASLDLRTVLDSITENALRLVQARDVHLYVYDEEQGEFTLGVARWDITVLHTEVHSPRREGLTAQVVRDRHPVIINDTDGHPFFSNPEARAWGIRSIAGFPLKRAERLLGVFNVAFLSPHAFTADELRVLTLLGDQAAVAIDNARLYAEARRRAEQVSALLATTAIISSTLDLDTRLQTIAEKARGLVAADGCMLFALEEDGQHLRTLLALHPYAAALRALRIPVGEGLSGRVAQTGRGEIINHAENDARAATIPDTPDEPECLVSVPLLVEERVIGVMTLHRDGAREFTAADLDLLSSFASQAAVAIENARLYQEVKVRAQTLQRAYDELAEADRLKDELVQNVSHELRTPLTFIKGYVELLVSGELGPLEAEQAESLRIVLAKTDVLVRLVSDVVSLQAISAESLELVEVELRELTERARAGVEVAVAEAGLNLRVEAPPSVPRVYADVDRVLQVFDNLLANAIKFSPAGSTIVVRLLAEEGRVRVEVEDQGIGIAADKHARIFERFYQVDGTTTRRFGGAGLGLAISKQIIEAHRGEIGVARSAPGAGTTLYFTLVSVPDEGQELDW